MFGITVEVWESVSYSLGVNYTPSVWEGCEEISKASFTILVGKTAWRFSR